MRKRKWPEFLQYSVKVSKLGFTQQPSNELEIEQLLTGDPAYWVDQSEFTSQQNPKTLVFADWSLARLTPSILRKLHAVLKALHDDDYEIYICKNGEAVRYHHCQDNSV